MVTNFMSWGDAGGKRQYQPQADMLLPVFSPRSPLCDIVSSDLKTCCPRRFDCDFGVFIAVQRKMEWMFILLFVSEAHTLQ